MKNLGAITLAVAVGFFNPDIARCQPGAGDYRTLAGQISLDYILDNEQHDSFPLTQNISGLEELAAKAQNPGVRKAAEIAKFGASHALSIRGSAKRAADSATAKAAKNNKEVQEALDRGDYRHKETRYFRDMNGNIHAEQVETDSSWFARLFLMSPTGGRPDLQAEEMQVMIAAERAKLAAWDDLIPNVPAQFAGPKAPNPLVEISYVDDGPRDQKPKNDNSSSNESPADRFRGRYLAKNVSGRDMTSVTIAVELFHYSTLPEVTLRHIYFIPRWNRGETLQFSRSFILDLDRGGKKYRVTSYGKGLNGSVDPELSRMAGIVRMRCTVWCNEAQQPATDIEFPQRAEIVADALLGQAHDSALTSGAPPAKPVATAKTKRQKPGAKGPGLPYAERMRSRMKLIVGPILDFMPKDSPQAEAAKSYIENFPAMRQKALAKLQEDLNATCAEGLHYSGKWMRGDVGFAIELAILASDPKRQHVKAELTDSRPNAVKRILKGRVEWDEKAHKHMLKLEAATGKKPTSPIGRDALDEPQLFNLMLKDGSLVGYGDSGYTQITLTETADAAEKADAKR